MLKCPSVTWDTPDSHTPHPCCPPGRLSGWQFSVGQKRWKLLGTSTDTGHRETGKDEPQPRFQKCSKAKGRAPSFPASQNSPTKTAAAGPVSNKRAGRRSPSGQKAAPGRGRPGWFSFVKCVRLRKHQRLAQKNPTKAPNWNVPRGSGRHITETKPL